MKHLLVVGENISSNFYKIWSPLELIDSPNIGGLIGPLVTSNISIVWEEIPIFEKVADFAQVSDILVQQQQQQHGFLSYSIA